MQARRFDTKSVAVFMISLTAVAGFATAAPFQNGGFESPGIAPNSQLSINLPAQAPTGWLGGGALGNCSLFNQSNLWIAPQSGLASIEFGGNGTTGATLEQSFDTMPGLGYIVNFYTTAQQLGNGPQSYRAEALSGATVLGLDAGPIPVLASWTLQSFSFVASSAITRLLFTDTSNGPAAGSINWALDSVRVTAVPEPSSLGLLSLRLVGLALLRRRQKSTR